MTAALRRTTLLALALVLSVVFAPSSGASLTGTADDESAFVSHLNADRAGSGLHRLIVSSDLVAVARRHAQRMADAGDHFHNPNLANEVSGWRTLGENVGQGPTVSDLHQAFMASPSHRANILHREFTQVGIGVVRNASGRIFVVEVFRTPTAAAAAPAPAPAPAPKPAPAPAPVPAAAPAPAPAPVPAAAPAPAPTTTTIVAPAPTTSVPEPVTRPTAQTADMGAASAGAETAAAAVDIPAPTERSVTAAVVLAAALINVLLAAHAGVLRRSAQS